MLLLLFAQKAIPIVTDKWTYITKPVSSWISIAKPLDPSGFGAEQWQAMTITWASATKEWNDASGGWTYINKPT